jgi:phosphoribosylamine-glycine ligase
MKVIEYNNRKMDYEKVKAFNLLQRDILQKVYTKNFKDLIMRSFNFPTTRFASA